MDIMETIVKEVKSENEKLVILNKKLVSRNKELRNENCDKIVKIKELINEMDLKNKELLAERLKKNPLLRVNA
jgi:cell division protein ZapA